MRYAYLMNDDLDAGFHNQLNYLERLHALATTPKQRRAIEKKIDELKEMSAKVKREEENLLKEFDLIKKKYEEEEEAFMKAKGVDVKIRKFSKEQMVTVARAFRMLQQGAVTGEQLVRRAMTDESAVQELIDHLGAIEQLTFQMGKGISQYLAASDLLDHIQKVSKEQRPKHLKLLKGGK